MVRGTPMSPTYSQWFATLPQAAEIAAPSLSTGLRTATQAGGAEVWPAASTMLGPPPPTY
jgi:hypothetical protein